MDHYENTYTASVSPERAEAVGVYSRTLDHTKLAQVAEQLNKADGAELYTSLFLMQMLAAQNPELQSALGDRFYSGTCVRQDENKAMHMFSRAADGGSVRSKYDKAWYYYDRQEYMQALEYFKECVQTQSGLDDVMLGKSHSCLGVCYKHIPEPKQSQALEHFAIAADKYHDNFGCRCLGLMYGEKGERHFDPGKSILYLERAANNGDDVAARELGSFYVFGNEDMNIRKNGPMAEKYLLPLAEQENAVIWCWLGKLYLNGDPDNGMERKLDRAAEFYKRAANLTKNTNVVADLGYVYFLMNRYQDAEKYLVYADSKNVVTYSDFLGRMYAQGDLGQKDLKKAMHYYGRSYDAGQMNNLFTCAEYVEVLMQLGLHQKAYDVCEKGKEKYNDMFFFHAQAEMILKRKISGAMQIEEALAIMEECIRRDHEKETAYLILGHHYYATGNYRMAEARYLDAFDANVADAGVYLGRLYELGGGTITPNDNMAYAWYEKAAQKGSVLGQQELSCWKKGLFGCRRVRSLNK